MIVHNYLFTYHVTFAYILNTYTLWRLKFFITCLLLYVMHLCAWISSFLLVFLSKDSIDSIFTSSTIRARRSSWNRWRLYFDVMNEIHRWFIRWRCLRIDFHNARDSYAGWWYSNRRLQVTPSSFASNLARISANVCFTNLYYNRITL